jgi:hypothetical protein
MLRRKTALFALLAGCLVVGLGVWAFFAPLAPAAPLMQETPTPDANAEAESPTRTPVPNLSISDEYCLSCHGQPGQTFALDNGEQLDLYVPAELHQSSVHGRLGYACVQCHTDVGEYPHPPFKAADRRDVALQLNAVCQRCHNHQFELAQDSVHADAQLAGVREAAVCVDCHTAHEVRRLNDPQTHQLLPDAHTWIPERCALCHNAIYQKYKESVHGAALSQGNLDVPTCIDCHGVHNIEDPRTTYFRLRSPSICAKCHTDPKIMNKYGLSTQVLDTYVADFHGTTTVIFEKQAPDAQINTPVCYDCHGIHDISKTTEPKTGLQMRSNLLARCQECHPDANTNFPAAWMSHYIPSRERYSLVYYVDLFYKIFIPLTLGGMGALVLMDISRTLINRLRKRAAQAAKETAEAGQPLIAPQLASAPVDLSEAAQEEEASVEPAIEPEAGQPASVEQVALAPADPSETAEAGGAAAQPEPQRQTSQPVEEIQPDIDEAGQPASTDEIMSSAPENPTDEEIDSSVDSEAKNG